MNAAVTRAVPEAVDPIGDFSHCHEGILQGLGDFSGLAALQEAAARSRDIAGQVMRLMDEAVMLHHDEEEKELFTAVMESSRPGAERDRVKGLVLRLTEEHRDIEQLWRRVRGQVRSIAAGKAADLDQRAVDLLVDVYRMHARSEETEFLPLARDILGRNGNHMAALGLALHMRHAPVPIGHI
jgi:hypothetical protein